MPPFMYILQCANGKYYTGSTRKSPEERLTEHQQGKRGANFTAKHLPVILVYFERFPNIGEAFNREKQIQGWTRKKKEALINGKSNQLKELSKKDFG